MKRISFSVDVPEWHFYDDRRRWVYDLTDPDVTEEAWNEERIIASMDAEGYFERPDQFDPLPAGSWRPLPFRYFERASDIPVGNVEIERLMVAFGIKVTPSNDARHINPFKRMAHAVALWWRNLVRPDDIHMHDVLFLRLVMLTPFQKRPPKKHDFRIDVYEPDEPLP